MNRAGNCRRPRAHGANTGNQFPLLILIHRTRGRRGRLLAVINHDGVTVGHANQHEAPAAQVSRLRECDRQYESDGHGGIHGIAPRLEHFRACLAGQRFAGSDHAVAPGHRSAGRMQAGASTTARNTEAGIKRLNGT